MSLPRPQGVKRGGEIFNFHFAITKKGFGDFFYLLPSTIYLFFICVYRVISEVKSAKCKTQSAKYPTPNQ